ncbi:amidohydrolase [Acinetobacter gerneri]|uniref:Amidohydrolase n=1 Tax=Acinetobacter gerneri TaxID=202952 RepID=A0AAW8JLP5_9GAMM|nr:amidohydrolase [Acinetobacter gerneri]MDQ9011428.1 amidohydrolase [Acinetobacter gerneri]MDQ9015564.1 amidohydrolase [Acinetobacter gerneri]MDQ9026769.1 amidohydrolase [Acinetobacter gerneri]MDQ9054050.1 amidohydrolase [Acinetobacter gerneri]MDQ9061720.1 amidohydrolase [Acinetobacter gerneri]
MSDIQLILKNGKITTLNPQQPEVQAIAISDGKIAKAGKIDDIMKLATSQTKVVDLNGRRVIPGLNDSHLHIIRGGLNYNMELRWEGVPSVADALRLLKEQADNTPAPQWVRVVGGWTEFQFAERRMPTIEEINKAAPDTPVFVLHLYASAILNKAAIRALGFNKDTPDVPGGRFERDANGELTGLVLATPAATILYSTLGKAPKLELKDQINSTRHFMRELNRLGLTSAIDAGGGGQNYPDDYEVIQELHKNDQMTVRIAYNLFAQNAGTELDDYKKWTEMTFPGDGDALFKMNGAGENLTWSAGDFENFYEPRPDLPEKMEAELEKIVELLAEKKWPFRIHATYDESIGRLLNVFERVNAKQPFATRFIIDHAETVSERNIDRIGALGGGIAIQHRMAYQGEIFVKRYGAEAAKDTPPVKKMLEMGVPVGAGTDATRVASYNPWVCLGWLATGKTVGGLPLYDEKDVLDRQTALKLWTKGSAWFSGEQADKGALVEGELADLAVLSDDYFQVEGEDIQWIESVLTVMGGKVVYAGAEFKQDDPPIPPASPDWSPVKKFGGYWRKSENRNAPSNTPLQSASAACACSSSCGMHGHSHAWLLDVPINEKDKRSFWGALGCSCFAF